MGAGDAFKHGFNSLLEHLGGTVLVHKKSGAGAGKTLEFRGLKNNEKHRTDKVMFQFPEVVDIAVGDVLQQKGARDTWTVTELEDNIHGDVYVNFEAKVVKGSGSSPTRPGANSSQLVVHGPVFGSIQVNSPNAVQNSSVDLMPLHESVSGLRELLKRSPVSELEKEEAELALDRISQLAKREKTPDTVAKIKEKLDLVKVTFDVAKDVAELALPFIVAIDAFCK